jgi:uncharacterized protein YkwD
MRPSVTIRWIAFLVASLLSVSAQNLLAAAGDQGDSQAVINASASELEMLKLLNTDRLAPSSAEEMREQARPLVWDDRLAAVARQHSEEMAEHGYFSHQGLDGSEPAMRVSRAGIRWRSTGENIAKFSDVASAEAGFMNEPHFQQHNHRGNILSAGYTHVGIGVVKGPDGMLYITQEFAGF